MTQATHTQGPWGVNDLAADLLEALKQLACEADEDMPTEYRTDSFKSALEAAWDAIAKADGENQ